MLMTVAWVACSYPYRVQSCTVRCSSGACPPGFQCLDDAYCHASADEEMCPCVPRQCDDVPGACGDLPDLCGGTVSCGGCTAPLECGGGGTPNVCGDPASCVPEACQADQCGPITDTCGNPATCPDCPAGMKCSSGTCVPCTPECVDGELACGDDMCGGSCGSCPDSRWTCHPAGVCCIKSGEHCQPLLEGCNCCPGLFCVNGICQPDTGCAMAPDLSAPSQ